MRHLNRQERLQRFVELACYRPSVSGFHLCDPSHPYNKKRAYEWFRNELTFLGKRDSQELERIWSWVIEDGRDTNCLFGAVKTLQGKYKECLDISVTGETL